jgi:hypothetical protein
MSAISSEMKGSSSSSNMHSGCLFGIFLAVGLD